MLAYQQSFVIYSIFLTRMGVKKIIVYGIPITELGI